MHTHLHPWDLLDPDTALDEILDRERPGPGTTVIARIAVDPQAVLGTRVLRTPSPSRPRDAYDVGHDEEARADLSDRLLVIAEGLVPEPARIPPGQLTVLYTVVCREGYVVDTATEWQFETAWRYANHASPVLLGDIAVVTPDGWLELCSDRAGRTPALSVGSSPVGPGR